MLKDRLKEIYIFSSLDDKKLSRLVEISHEEKLNKGCILFYAGDLSNYIYVLIEGLIQVYKHDDQGNEVIIGIFNKPSLIAEAATLQGVPLPSTAICKNETKLIKIKLEEFRNEFLSDINIANEIINSLLGKIQLLQQNIHLNLASNAKDKILNFYTKHQKFAKQLKQYEIANILSISQETLSRNLKQLIKEGLIEKN